MSEAIITEQLRREFRVDKEGKRREAFVALDGVDLEVNRGEIFGLLGPNGAGKTTLIKILSTLLTPTSGRAVVGGFDVTSDPYSVRRIINMVSGGEHSGYGILTVRENLWLFSQLYGIPNRVALERIDRLMDIVGLSDRARTKVHKLSTGQRQKMNFIRGFISDPEILFLDEPTLGLDVETSRVIRKYIREWVDGRPDRTVLLTTHYMAEADQLCDRLAIVNQGRILACDTPSALKRRVGQDSVLEIDVSAQAGRLQDLSGLSAKRGVRRVAISSDGQGALTHKLSVIVDGDGAIPGVLEFLAQCGAIVTGFKKTEPTLEDVFLELVGRRLTGENGSQVAHKG
ncbi:MAG: ATP-binding cassette domain-containing protein [Bacillota bacterium]